ncbi:MAG: DUF3592 domain-containing protein [Anaerolineales bacterium]
MVSTFINSIIKIITTDPLILFILAITFGVLGVVLSFIYWDKLNADRKCTSWPSVPGKITFSRIEKRSNFDWHNRGRYTRYVPVIKYSYNVGGTSYHAEQIGNGIYVGITRNAVKYWTNRFPVGTTAPVYYDPANPSTALLVPKTNSNIIGFIVGIGISMSSIFLVGLWLYRLLNKN